METKHRRRAMVTGASEGIGRVFAERLARKGFLVTVVARNEARLDSLVGGDYRKCVADLATSEGLEKVVEELAAGARYQLLVNNAGAGLIGDFAKTPIAWHREMLRLNLLSLVELSHAFLQRAERGDALIQVSSTLSFTPMPSQALYSATKAFVTSFSESLWFQNRAKGVLVLNLCPGSTKTLFQMRSGGSEKNIPSFITQSAEEVVDFALRAFKRKSGPTLVSGWKNRLFLFLARWLTRKQQVKLMGCIRQ